MLDFAALLLALLATDPGVSDSLMGPGGSRSLAEYRRGRIRDVHYDLSLDVTQRDTASGRIAVRFSLQRPVDVILDFRGHALEPGEANGRPMSGVDWNRAHVRIPAALLRAGVNRLDFAFKTPIAAAGASIIRVRDPSDGETYLYTLLVPSDANLLFPCFDQPDIKARLSLTLITPPAWKAVANGARIRDDSSSNVRTHGFRETEPISTYLMAFAAGPWTEFRSAGARKPITLFVRKSRAKEVDADSIIVANDRAATWLEEYFGTPFPFQKLDVVLAPAFPFGGMEHPGAIFYSEERFVFRERATRTQLLGRTATVYHEVAHQWFGDLVTMKWFDDLWLKEGFATYMAAKMQADIDPASEAWKSFYLRNKPSAYAVDITDGTTPIWQRLGNLDQAKSNYGAIVYNKAPSVLKQLNYLVGDAAFRRGLRTFLRRHAYANATWRELLDAIGESSGRPLRAWGDQYILRPGMPIIEQSITVRDGRIARLALVQHPARPLSGPKPWPIKLELLIARDTGLLQRIPLTLASETTFVDRVRGTPSPSFVFANSSDNAHALVLLDSGSVDALERSIGDVRDGLLRAQLWGALWDLVREARLAPDRFVRLALRELPRERDEQIVQGIVGRLTRATVAYLSPMRKAAILSSVEEKLLEQLNDTSRSYDIRKAQLDAYVRVAASPASIATLDGMLDSASLAGAPLRAPTRWAIVTRLQALGAPTAERRLAAESSRDSTAEGARRAFVARAARPDSATKADYFRRYFADSSLNEDWATASLDAFNDLDAQRLTRRYLRPALDSLPWIQRNRRIFFLGSWLGGFLEGQADPEAVAIVRSFLSDRADLAPDLRSKVEQSVDELERTVRLRRVFGEGGISMTPFDERPFAPALGLSR
jgi:aminopeptidase N